MSRNGQIALRYADQGMYVLPVGPEKRPLIAGGVHASSREPGIIRKWWGVFPDANIAIASGPRSGVLVVDVDPRNSGFDTLAQIEFDHEPLRTTVARTGSGGEHYVYRYPTIPDGMGLCGKLGSGIDVLGAGRYFVVWPSVSHTGPYRWLNPHPLRDMSVVPDWLLGLILRPIPERIICEPHLAADPSQLERARRYLAAIPPAISGSGGHTHTFLVAQKLVHGFSLNETDAVRVLQDWNSRCSPPWSHSALLRKVQQAIRKGYYSRKL